MINSTVNIDSTLDFPFLAELPKREKSKMANFWDRLAEMRAVSQEKGPLIPIRFAARLLGISHQRVTELMKLGRLECYEVDGHSFVPESSLVAFAKSERKAGRPPKVVTSYSECVKVAIDCAKELVKE